MGHISHQKIQELSERLLFVEDDLSEVREKLKWSVGLNLGICVVLLLSTALQFIDALSGCP